ncbi:MAG: hypothetical protein FJ146_14520 [Deltaproteobacteria bacterium]|nr:hypothetical protein [Deltaproteobacteria bacterium]
MAIIMRLVAIILGLSTSGCSYLFLRSPSDPVLSGGSDPCYNISKENAQHPVTICERERYYSVQVIGKIYKFNKTEFHARFYDHLRNFLYRSAAPQKLTRGMTVDIWLAAPVFAPDDAAWVAVVATDEGYLAFRLPLLLDHWTMSSANAVWLGSNDHPTLRAIRTDQVIVTPQPGITPAEALRFIEDSGVGAKLDVLGRPIVQRAIGDGSMIRLDTLALGAPQVARAISRSVDARKHLMAINYAVAGGRDSYQAKVFRFTLP